jgi:hypothetical protein
MLLILKPDRIVARDNIFGPVGSITFVMATACLDHRSRVRVNLRLRGHAYHLGGCRRISSLRHLVAELQNKSSPSNRRGTGKAERIIARTSIARESRRGCRGEGLMKPGIAVSDPRRPASPKPTSENIVGRLKSVLTKS